jgi:hypothetical protein
LLLLKRFRYQREALAQRTGGKKFNQTERHASTKKISLWKSFFEKIFADANFNREEFWLSSSRLVNAARLVQCALRGCSPQIASEDYPKRTQGFAGTKFLHSPRLLNPFQELRGKDLPPAQEQFFVPRHKLRIPS